MTTHNKCWTFYRSDLRLSLASKHISNIKFISLLIIFRVKRFIWIHLNSLSYRWVELLKISIGFLWLTDIDWLLEWIFRRSWHNERYRCHSSSAGDWQPYFHDRYKRISYTLLFQFWLFKCVQIKYKKIRFCCSK